MVLASNVLAEGAAAAHDLPTEYSNELAKLDGTYTPLLSELMGLLIYARVMLQAVNPNAKCTVQAN